MQWLRYTEYIAYERRVFYVLPLLLLGPWLQMSLLVPWPQMSLLVLWPQMSLLV